MNWIKIIVQSISAGMVGMSAAVIGAITAGGTEVVMSLETWLVGMVFAIAAIGKDLGAQFSEPKK